MASLPLPLGEALLFAELLPTSVQGMSSRVLARGTGGNLTLFAFAAGQGLSEHMTPHEAMVIVLEGRLTLTIGGAVVAAQAGTVVRLPARVPHAVSAPEPARMLLLLLHQAEAAIAPQP